MVGHANDGIVEYEMLLERLQCQQCKLLLRDAVRLPCGHLTCASCQMMLCSGMYHKCPFKGCSHDATCLVDATPATPERTVILNARSLCMFRHNGCTWCGTLSDRVIHQNTCDFLPCVCPTCKLRVPSTGLADHLAMCPERPSTCPFSQVGCKSDMLACPSVDAHICDSVHHHMMCMAGRIKDICRVDRSGMSNKHLETGGGSGVTPPSNEALALIMADMSKLMKQHQKLVDDVAYLKVEQTVNMNTVFDGIKPWVIDQFHERMHNSKTGSHPSHDSSPFFTSRCGYCLCIRVHLNGDGAGKNTHMSLFIVIKKSPYDSCNKWPFSASVTFTLLNQSGRPTHSDSFSTRNAISSSFLMPTSEFNTATGCPRFITHKILSEGGFLLENRILVKCFVHMNG